MLLLLLLRFLFLVLRSSVFFWDMLRHWHVDVRTISLPAAPYGPASCQGPITMMNGKQGVVEFRNPFDKPTDFSLQACQGFWIDCWILLNCSTWGIVLKYDLNWFIWYCTGSYWYMYWFYIVVNCANDHLLNVMMPCCNCGSYSGGQPLLHGANENSEETVTRKRNRTRKGDVDLLFVNVIKLICRYILQYVIIFVSFCISNLHVCSYISWSLNGFNMHPVPAFIWAPCHPYPAIPGSTHKKRCRFPWISNQTGGRNVMLRGVGVPSLNLT